ncbi:hypothetical protein BHE74_00032922 [Ensete ventricosum]|nr:hypothetical protein GW17_00055796 [Ensete ventricosum]RWW60103.1 hypothetical protein BHE74_00032922 [Ensete ventricosum]RZS02809.1 hypothetical protein BHM03_00032890 [Ensete ventricosum]
MAFRFPNKKRHQILRNLQGVSRETSNGFFDRIHYKKRSKTNGIEKSKNHPKKKMGKKRQQILRYLQGKGRESSNGFFDGNRHRSFSLSLFPLRPLVADGSKVRGRRRRRRHWVGNGTGRGDGGKRMGRGELKV